MDDILLEPMFEELTLSSSGKNSSVVLTLTDALAVNAGTVIAKDLISSDPNNDLKLGSDNKLVSQPNDINFLAYYILSKG